MDAPDQIKVETLNNNEQAGFDLDVSHDKEAAWLIIRIRLPKGRVLRTLTDLLVKGSGFERTQGL